MIINLAKLIFLLLIFMPLSAHSSFQRTKIAVLDFEVVGDKVENSSIGTMVAEWFITSIVKTGRFDVVERALIEKIIEEQKLSATGLIDENSATKIGKILGVKAIVTGSVLNLKDRVEVNSRLINVENGSIIAAESISSEGERDTRLIVEKLTVKIINNFPLTGYIVKKSPKTVIIDLGSDSGLAIGTEFTVYKEGEIIKHPKTGEILNIAQVVTGRILIQKIDSNTAEGEIISEEGGGIEYGHQIKSIVLQKEVKGTKSKNGGVSDANSGNNSAGNEIVKDQESSKIEEKNHKLNISKEKPKQNIATQSSHNVSIQRKNERLHKKMDSFDRAQVSEILEQNRFEEYNRWINPLTGNKFNIKLDKALSLGSKSTCRMVTISVKDPTGNSEISTSTYCRNSKGFWEVR